MRAIAVLVFLTVLAPPAAGYLYWNDIRNSAELPDTTVTVRVENPTGSGEENYVLYNDGGVQELLMAEVVDGPSTLQADVQASATGSRPVGFRLITGAEIDFMPVKLSDGVTPEPGDLTRLATDPSGDEAFGYDNLDLVDCHVSFSDTELHAALRNVGGGFPVSQFLTFFSYLLAMADPAEAAPDTVFTMMETYEQAGIISPGLYKVTGPSTSDLVKLGDVQVIEYPAINTLMISCQLADLVADPYFASWYDPADPAIGVVAITQRITLLGGAQEADQTPGGRCYLREYEIEPGPNELPVVSDAVFLGSGSTASAEVDYDDADGHCPVLAEVVFDGTETYPLSPKSLDYGTTVTYTTAEGIEPLADETWSLAVFRFSDNGADVVELSVPPTGVEHSPDPTSGLLASVSPNPFTGTTTIELAMPAPGQVRVEVYDLRGRLVSVLSRGPMPRGRSGMVWNGRDETGAPVGSGVYFLRIEALGRQEVRKVVLSR